MISLKKIFKIPLETNPYEYDGELKEKLIKEHRHIQMNGILMWAVSLLFLIFIDFFILALLGIETNLGSGTTPTLILTSIWFVWGLIGGSTTKDMDGNLLTKKVLLVGLPVRLPIWFLFSIFIHRNRNKTDEEKTQLYRKKQLKSLL